VQGTIFSPHNDNGILDAGDIESMPFIEALGQFSYRVGKKTTVLPEALSMINFHSTSSFYNFPLG
jgi:CTP synthase (UTP-ammonia lyase)